MGDTTAVQNSKNMAKAKAKIVLSVDKVNYTHIRDATTLKEVWDKLKKTFEDKGLTRKVGLLRTLITTQLENCESTEDYINDCTEARRNWIQGQR